MHGNSAHTHYHKKLAVALYVRLTPSSVSDKTVAHYITCMLINPLMPKDQYSGRTAPLTSKRCILYIY